MNKAYTFITLCETYNKVEIPIIQRDYAQGRNTADVQRIREKFINVYLIPAVVEHKPIELDFVYGTVLTEIKDEVKLKTFIPLDGQQRLTTLFLLHIFIALKEQKLAEVRSILSKFTYETRPSAHDFCRGLLDMAPVTDVDDIKFHIEDSVWFNDEWHNDPTVSGMLNVLDEFAGNKTLIEHPTGLLNKLLDKDQRLISFYFTDLEQFGLTESLYIRMNARGKMLTEFENFKSEFFKIIRYDHALLEDVKDKIEYAWVDNLWDYKKPGAFVIDDPFMRFLRFITEMLYYSDAPYRAPVTSYESDFLDFKVLGKIYSKKENLEFLIFALDHIKVLKTKQFKVLWNNDGMLSLNTILKEVIDGSTDIDRSIILFASFKHGFERKPADHLEDFVRVIRNLIYNTEDKSRREWSRLITSLGTLIADKNVYELLAELKDDNSLIGYNVNQRKEEIYKARLILKLKESKSSLIEMEDHSNFKGNISNLLITPFVNTEQAFAIAELETLTFEQKQLTALGKIFTAYRTIAKNDFNPIWGNLLASGLYELTYESRLIYAWNFKKHPAILIFAKRFNDSKLALDAYTENIQRAFIKDLMTIGDDFSVIRDVKRQLYLYFIIHERVYEKRYDSFFKNNNFNFGWLVKETGFRSLFSQGIAGCRYFPTTNPIFQLYNSQFRYNSGLNKANTLDIEIVGGGKKREPFKLVQEWAINEKVTV